MTISRLCYTISMPKSQKQTRAARSTRRSFAPVETDGMYLLKLVMVIILGTFWLKFHSPLMFGPIPLAGIPLGAIVGVVLVRYQERLQTDRKIWYAVLLVVTILTYFSPAGIVI